MANKTDYQIKMLLKDNRDGSQYTRQTRYERLNRFITHLQEERGYSKRWDLSKISKKEVHRYVNDLKNKGLNHRTISNQLIDIRWVARKQGREKLIPSNRECGLRQREISAENKAARLTQDNLSMMDERMQLINQLKAEFGLREKEALKFGHREATAQEGKLQLQGNWCKNGRPRSIEITNDRQIELLQEVGKFQELQGDYSMIPHEMKFSTYRNYVQEKSNDIGIKGHSFRHQWAQDRFKQLSGLDCPIAEGPQYSSLDQEQKKRWDYAASIVIPELGHGKNRLDTLATYIGSRG